jgi:DNA helicase HerA-like ATPase
MSEIVVGAAGDGLRTRVALRLDRANRHGLIAGATGTGKTVTLQILAEGFSAAGVPVLLPDVKGDLSGLGEVGAPGEKLRARAEAIGLADYAPAAFPTVFWDVFGEKGHPVRATVSELGPLLLARLLELNETQEGALTVVFRMADEEGLPILDLKDLRAVLTEASARASELSARWGLISTASLGAIQRRLLVLETEGADRYFGEPALRLSDLIATEADGRGRVNVLAADRLMRSPRLYAVALLNLLSALFEELPEVGDPPKPVLAVFFDEAHLLFDDAPKPLLDKIEQVARLIRSKGVSLWFVTQSPADVPDAVLAQLGARVQHALRAYTPKERRALKAAADSFRPNPGFRTEDVLTELGVGEALVSTLDAKGAPGVVERTLVRPPSSTLGPARPETVAALRAASPLGAAYDATIDRESAHEMLKARAETAAEEAEAWEEAVATQEREFRNARRYRPGVEAKPPRAPSRRGDTTGKAFAKSLARSLGTAAGRSIARGVLGGLFKGR